MAFTIPEDLPKDLYPLAWLIGTWIGTGICEYPDVARFDFSQEVTFAQGGENFLTYISRTNVIDENRDFVRPFSAETGFWKIKDARILEVVITHSTGHSDGWLGVVDTSARIQMALDHSYASPSADAISAGSRLYGLVEGELFTSNDLAMRGHDLQAFTWSTLQRQA
jgi:hypothetical protein